MTTSLSAPPITPDGDEARRWAERELADPIYRAAEPTAFDRFARDVGEFIEALFSGGVPTALTPWIAFLVVTVVVVVVVLAVIIWGRPRRTVRARTAPTLFGTADARPAAQLRTDAEAAASRADWDDAIVLRFRAIARSLLERTVIDLEPGATVHRFSRMATASFPDEGDALDSAADLFDDVRYLDRSGSESGYRLIADLDTRLAATRPASFAAPTHRMPT